MFIQDSPSFLPLAPEASQDYSTLKMALIFFLVLQIAKAQYLTAGQDYG